MLGLAARGKGSRLGFPLQTNRQPLTASFHSMRSARTSCGILILALLSCGACAVTARADGPGSYVPKAQSTAALDGQEALRAYHAAYALIQRAEHHESLAAVTTDAAVRRDAQQRSRECYEQALEPLAAAVRADASMHEAYTYLGFVQRKLGRHEQALRSYAAALAINPNYTHAIEYQGQAFLALDRIDAARFNYLRLYALNPGHANKLLRAMQRWVDTHRTKPPRDVDVDGFAAWVSTQELAPGPEGAW